MKKLREKNYGKKALVLLLALIMILASAIPAMAYSNTNLDQAVNQTAAYLYSLSKNVGVGQTGGEWVVMGLARSGYNVPDSYYENYYKNLEAYVKECKGVLHNKKYTEYSRVIIAVTAIGKDARNVGGYDLTVALGDYEKTIWQGLNGPIWALIALDSGNYPIPTNKEATVQATRQMYIDRILSCQLSDGGWSLTGGTSSAVKGDEEADIDITAMALQALAKYQDQPKVAKATKEALDCMSKRQHADAGFDSWGTTNSESCVQMMVALGELGISLNDPRFVKNGRTMLDDLMEKFYIPNKGFRHTADGDTNGMASEQGFYGIVSAQRAAKGMNSLYRMGDHISFGETSAPVATAPVVKPVDKTEVSFSDIAGNKNEAAIIELASRKIINGMGEGTFQPDSTMTRAQFATIVTKSMGYEPIDTKKFKDVPSNKWYAGYIGAANKAGIVNGRTAETFDPEGLITRQEAAVMVANAAKLCAMNTELSVEATRDVLAAYSDYVTIATWAQTQMAFCYSNNIYNQEDLKTNPTVKITRGEIAQMLYNMLTAAAVI